MIALVSSLTEDKNNLLEGSDLDRPEENKIIYLLSHLLRNFTNSSFTG